MIPDIEKIKKTLVRNPGGSFTLRAGFCWRTDSRSRPLFTQCNVGELRVSASYSGLMFGLHVPFFYLSHFFLVCSVPYLDVPLGGDVDTPVYLGRMTEKG